MYNNLEMLNSAQNKIATTTNIRMYILYVPIVYFDVKV